MNLVNKKMAKEICYDLKIKWNSEAKVPTLNDKPISEEDFEKLWEVNSMSFIDEVIDVYNKELEPPKWLLEALEVAKSKVLDCAKLKITFCEINFEKLFPNCDRDIYYMSKKYILDFFKKEGFHVSLHAIFDGIIVSGWEDKK